jgi:DNA polymerase III gamma/tau subunit
MARQSKKQKPSSLVSNIWIKLLIVGALIISVVQLVLHAHPEPTSKPVQTATSPPDGIKNLVANGVSDVVSEALTKSAAASVEVVNLKQSLRESQHQLKANEELLSNYKRRIESLQLAAAAAQFATQEQSKGSVTAVSSSEGTTSSHQISSSIQGAVMSSREESYRVSRAHCDLMLKQRTLIATMSEDYAFIKYNRGKVFDFLYAYESMSIILLNFY